MAEFNFDITSPAPVSVLFTSIGVKDFTGATEYVKALPYKRNTTKSDLTAVFTEHGGTCSTKHALLRQLAIENNANKVKLMLGIFKMNPRNTPLVSRILEKYGLDYIPEAHNYLNVAGQLMDCTSKNSTAKNFVNDLLTEMEIEPAQVAAFKISYHQKALKQWLSEQPSIRLTPDQLWEIREECIRSLAERRSAGA